MKLISLINVTHPVWMIDSIVTMTILGFNHVGKCNSDGSINHTVEVEYEYSLPSGYVFKRDVFTLTDSDSINTFHSSISSELPAFESYTKSFEDNILIGAKLKFAETFSITLSDIEEVI